MEQNLQQRFNSHLKTLQVDGTQHYLLAVSGGIDSVVLSALCHEASLSFSILHCNFGLRGVESNRDEAFVNGLGKRYNIPVLVKHFETTEFAEKNKLSIQEAARVLRYAWFEEVRQEKESPYIFLAHHANDNIETLLMHFFRGSGLSGLTGMPAKTNYLAKCLRPLLPFTRKEIETFANEKGLTWVEDSSNSADKYTRNFFRNTLLPQIKQVYPQAEENLLQNIDRLQKTDNLYQQLLQKEKQTFYKKSGGEVKIAINKLLQYSNTSMLYEVVKDFHFSEKAVPELLKLMNAESGRYIENETYRIIKHRAWLLIAARQEKSGQTFIIEKSDKKLFLPEGTLGLEWIDSKNFNLKKSNSIAQLDARQLQFPLLLRRWQHGDYFYPLGMPKKKKLSRFFIDQKLAATDKEKVWVLESGKKIAWVVGHRIDDRFKIVPHTSKILQITFTPY